MFIFILYVNFAPEKYMTMQYIAYGNIAQDIEEKKSIIDSLKQMDCPIYLDDDNQKKRERWKDFIDALKEGDTAVVYSFSNSFINYHDMIFFLKYCFAQNIRIISLADKLDTYDLLFPESHTQNVLQLICKMFLRKKKGTPSNETEYTRSKAEKKLKKYRLVINMYMAGYSIKDIMLKTGYKGKGSIYRILRYYKVDVAYPQKKRSRTSSSSTGQ